MSNLTPETLAELRRLENSGADRPWIAGTEEGVDYGSIYAAPYESNGIIRVPMIVDDLSPWPGTSELIVAAVNALPDLLDAADAMERVRDLHKPHPCDVQHSCCTTCNDRYPCRTIRALDGGDR